MTVQPDQYPSAVLEPGRARWLPDDPHHAHIEPADGPDPDEESEDDAENGTE